VQICWTKSGHEMPGWKKAWQSGKRKLSPLSERPPWSNDQKQTERMAKLRETFVAVEPPCGQSPPNDFPGKFLARQSKGPGRRFWLPAWGLFSARFPPHSILQGNFEVQYRATSATLSRTVLRLILPIPYCKLAQKLVANAERSCAVNVKSCFPSEADVLHRLIKSPCWAVTGRLSSFSNSAENVDRTV
jgi:hypothetical protein